MMVPTRLLQKSAEELSRFVDMEKDIEGHLYEGMVHSTATLELRDLLGWLDSRSGAIKSEWWDRTHQRSSGLESGLHNQD
jgi:hypothetical protein